MDLFLDKLNNSLVDKKIKDTLMLQFYNLVNNDLLVPLILALGIDLKYIDLIHNELSMEKYKDLFKEIVKKVDKIG